MLYSLSLPSSSPSYPPAKPLKPRHLSPSPHPSHYIKFRTAHHENLRYLKAIGVIGPNSKSRQFPTPDAISHILATLKFFESKGFLETDFARLTFLCPELLSLNFDITDIEPVFQFLTDDLHASVQESRGLVIKCPRLLFSDVEYFLRPTLNYLRQLGVNKLNVPSNLNAHLLNIRVEKMQVRFEFLRSIGFSHDEAANICGRLPAIFGYSIENNLRPKVEYLVDEMKRSLDELKEFPQYFAFSLEKKIMPRHLHLNCCFWCVVLLDGNCTTILVRKSFYLQNTTTPSRNKGSTNQKPNSYDKLSLWKTYGTCPNGSLFHAVMNCYLLNF